MTPFVEGTYEKCPKCGGSTRKIFTSHHPGHKRTHRRCLPCKFGYIVHEYTNVTDAGKLPVTWAKAMVPSTEGRPLRVKGRKVKA